MVSFIGKAQNYLNFTITNNSTACSGSGCVGTGITANSTMPGPVGPPPGGCGFLGFLYTLTINLY